MLGHHQSIGLAEKRLFPLDYTPKRSQSLKTIDFAPAPGFSAQLVKKVRKSSQLFRRLNQAQEQQRSGQTGRDGKRCAALLGLTRRGRHPAGRGQLPGSTTGKATTEALAVDAICLPSDMLQDRI